MSGSTSALGIFDSAYFPEISDDRSSYTSPITEINQEIRRTNASAAAASSQGPHMIAVQDANSNSDPWESFLDADHERDGLTAASDNGDGDTVCVCQIHNRRASRSFTSHPRTNVTARSRRHLLSSQSSTMTLSDASISAGATNVNSTTTEAAEDAAAQCPTCGKKRPLDSAGFAWTRPRSYPFSTQSASLLDGSIHIMSADGADEPQHAAALLQSTPLLRFLSPASTDINGAGNVTSPHLWSMVLAQVTGGVVGSSADTHASATSASALLASARPGAKAKAARDANGAVGGLTAYRASLVRDRANHRAAAELASLLWVLAHEMSLEDYGTVESTVFSSVFSLVHESDKERRMAGLAALDALLGAPSADEEKKAIKFANTLSNGLRAADGDFEFLSALSKALGHMAERTANVDFVESEVTRALEWLRTERSDRR